MSYMYCLKKIILPGGSRTGTVIIVTLMHNGISLQFRTAWMQYAAQKKYAIKAGGYETPYFLATSLIAQGSESVNYRL